MAKEMVINVYGIPPKTPEEQLMDISETHRNTFLYMEALIKAEKINPDKEEDYDGEYTAIWLKKIAICDTDVNGRIELIKLFEND